MEKDHFCLVTLPSGAACFSKGVFKKMLPAWEIFTYVQLMANRAK
jgi:hypothetical protein